MKNAAFACLLLSSALAGCAGDASSAADPEAYRAGYSDGCESASSVAGVPARRNDAVYKESADYRAGFGAGRASCGSTNGPR